MRKAKWVVVAGLVTVGTVWGVGVMAQNHGGFGGHGAGGFGPKMEFSQLDADGDGQVTVAEIKAAGADKFQQTDANGDGVVDVEEMTAQMMERMQERMAKGFSRMLEWRDTDGDGALSAAEFGNGPAQRMFSRADANNDGQLSEEEFNDAKSKGRRGHGGGTGRRGG